MKKYVNNVFSRREKEFANFLDDLGLSLWKKECNTCKSIDEILYKLKNLDDENYSKIVRRLLPRPDLGENIYSYVFYDRGNAVGDTIALYWPQNYDENFIKYHCGDCTTLCWSRFGVYSWDKISDYSGDVVSMELYMSETNFKRCARVMCKNRSVSLDLYTIIGIDTKEYGLFSINIYTLQYIKTVYCKYTELYTAQDVGKDPLYSEEGEGYWEIADKKIPAFTENKHASKKASFLKTIFTKIFRRCN